MAYWLTELEKAIYDRLTGDTGSGGLFNVGNELLATHPLGSSAGVGVYNTQIPNASSGTVFPAIVFQVTAAQGDDALRTATRQVRVYVSVEVQRTNPSGTSSAYNPLSRGALILQRVEGNWYEKAAGTAPDCGLDRWKPDLGVGTTWVSDILAIESWSAAHDDMVLRWELTFTALLSRSGA